MSPHTPGSDSTKSIITRRTFLRLVPIVIICIIFDTIQKLPPVVAHYYFCALIDNACHGLVGLTSWAAAIEAMPPRSCRHLGQILLCGLTSSALDVDHLLMSKSFHLADSLAQFHRPVFHSTTLILVIALILFLAARLPVCQRFHKLPYLFLIASLSHHIRDASRRGLWFWPLGSTPPLPYWLYVTLVCSLPVIVHFHMERTKKRDFVTHNDKGSITPQSRV